MKYFLTLMFAIFAYFRISAANYSSAGEAFFCGFIQMVLFGVIGYLVSFINRIKKETNEE